MVRNLSLILEHDQMSLSYPKEYLKAVEKNDTFQQHQIFENFIRSKSVILLLKGPPHKPHCKYSKLISNRLIKEGIRYYGFNVWECRDLEGDHFNFYDHLKLKCNTFPQLWVQGTFISNLSSLEDFDSSINELGNHIYEILGDEWVDSDALNPSNGMKFRVRDSRNGKIRSFSKLEDAIDWAKKEQMHLWYLRFPGYQDLTQDSSNIPKDEIISVCAESMIGESEKKIESNQSIWIKIPIFATLLFLGISLLK